MKRFIFLALMILPVFYVFNLGEFQRETTWLNSALVDSRNRLVLWLRLPSRDLSLSNRHTCCNGSRHCLRSRSGHTCDCKEINKWCHCTKVNPAIKYPFCFGAELLEEAAILRDSHRLTSDDPFSQAIKRKP
jgi:hypothetical protein